MSKIKISRGKNRTDKRFLALESPAIETLVPTFVCTTPVNAELNSGFWRRASHRSATDTDNTLKKICSIERKTFQSSIERLVLDLFQGRAPSPSPKAYVELRVDGGGINEGWDLGFDRRGFFHKKPRARAIFPPWDLVRRVHRILRGYYVH